MLFCAIDFETNGLDTNNDRITEVGAVLARVEEAVTLLHEGVSRLVYSPDYPPQSEEIIKVTGITDDMLTQKGVEFPIAVAELLSQFKNHGWPEFFIAHNKVFDESIFKAEMKRAKFELLKILPLEDLERLFDIPWICSIKDVQHSPRFRCRKLSHLALDYGIPVDPSTLHRALDDVLLLLKVLEKSVSDWADLRARLNVPWCTIRAMVPHPKKDNGVGKDKAKACGFGWECSPGTDGPKYPLFWVKQIRETDLLSEQSKLGYPIEIIERC